MQQVALVLESLWRAGLTANLQRGGEGSGEQCQVSNWPSWHLFTNHSLPLNTVACWTSDGRCAREKTEKAVDETHEPRSVPGVHYFVLVV